MTEEQRKILKKTDNNIRKMFILLAVTIFGAMFFALTTVLLHYKAVNEHTFTYQIGEKVKVKDATGFIIQHDLIGGLFTYDTEHYTIVVENTNAKIYVSDKEIKK